MPDARRTLRFRGANDIANTVGAKTGDRVRITIEAVVGPEHEFTRRDGVISYERAVDVDVSYGLELLRVVNEG